MMKYLLFFMIPLSSYASNEIQVNFEKLKQTVTVKVIKSRCTVGGEKAYKLETMVPDREYSLVCKLRPPVDQFDSATPILLLENFKYPQTILKDIEASEFMELKKQGAKAIKTKRHPWGVEYSWSTPTMGTTFYSYFCADNSTNCFRSIYGGIEILEFSVRYTKADDMPKIKVAAADRACVKDSDCEQVATQCSCSCGEGVNKKHVDKYRTQMENLCKSYRGEMCKVPCNGEVKCQSKVCTYVTDPKTAKETRPTLVAEQKKAVEKGATPLKGKFLDYIFKIQPDHKQPGYFISTNNLNNGYAYGAGPYDGAFIQFFLFRGNDADFVIRHSTGYEIPESKQKYGAEIEIYQFKEKQMTSKKISEVWPVKQIDDLFSEQNKKLKSQNEYKDWAFHKLIRLPIKGTTSLLKLCEKLPDPPFSTETSCVTIGELTWDKATFQVKPLSKLSKSTESI